MSDMKDLLNTLLNVDVCEGNKKKDVLEEKVEKKEKGTFEGRIPRPDDQIEDKISALLEKDDEEVEIEDKKDVDFKEEKDIEKESEGEKVEKKEISSKEDKKENLGRKEYFGSIKDQHYYLLHTDGGYQVQNQDGKEVYKSEEKEEDIVKFMIKAFEELKLENVAYDIFMKYVYPKLAAEEAEEMEETEEEMKIKDEDYDTEDFTDEEVEEARVKITEVLSSLVEAKKKKIKDAKKKNVSKPKMKRYESKEDKKLSLLEAISRYMGKTFESGKNSYITPLNEAKGVYLVSCDEFTGKVLVSESEDKGNIGKYIVRKLPKIIA